MEEDDHIGIGEWLVSLVILMIPFIGLLYFIVGMFTGKPSKKNFFRASFILTVIVLALYVGIFALIIGKSGKAPDQYFKDLVTKGGVSEQIEKNFRESIGMPAERDGDGWITLEKVDGKKVQVRLIRQQGSMLSLEQRDGKRIMMGMSSLTPASQEKITTGQ